MPGTNSVCDQVRVITHGIVIAFRDDHLASVGKQVFPAKLETERIIAFAKNSDERKSSKAAGERLGQLRVQGVAIQGIFDVVVKCADSPLLHARAKYIAALLIQMPANAESARRELGKEFGEHIELTNEGTAYYA